MKFFYVFFALIFIPFACSAENVLSQFKKIRNNNFEVTKVFETKDFYFSQVSYDWKKSSNRKILSRKGTLKSINIFKKYILETNKIPNINTFKKWGVRLFIKSKIKITESRKIEDRRYKGKYLVVFSFPKKNIRFKIDNINIENIISFNAKNHAKLSKSERNKFLEKLNFKDLILLWNIYELEKKYNLTNVLGKVNPIQYQKKVMEIIKLDKTNLNLLDKTPAFSYVIDNYIKNNKPSNVYDYLAILSGKCAHDDDFKNNLLNNNIDDYQEKKILMGKSIILDTLFNCKGFMRFEEDLNISISKEISKIDKMFSEGKDLDGLILLIEKALSKSPSTFKLWNYYSACLRAKNKFQEALIVSRVELSIALQHNDKNRYNKALKSYSKSRINMLIDYNKEQKQFLNTIL
jgi:hypothetical protein